MSQKFVKGRTNNHLTWVMVDATDFATPESALSAATKIKVYGKLRSGTGVNFVSSGTGSLTNDIVHVGPSALGIYTIALAKADLSDASAAWYDQYVISLSATGAAFQTLIVDGGIDESYLSNVASYLSNLISNLSDVTSNAYSAAVVGSSRVLLVQSRLSDLDSRLASEFSDMYSLLSDHHSTMNSQFAVQSNYLSNASNYLSYISGVVSGLGAGQSASAIAAKVWSDYESKVGASPSQVYSFLSNAISDLRSTTDSQFAVQSNYLSYISAVVSGLGAGASASAIADKVWSDFGSKVGATPSQLYSVVNLAGSRVSDIQSYLVDMSGMLSDTHSAAILAASNASDAASYALVVQSRLSDFQSVYTSDISDVLSAVRGNSDAISNVLSYLVLMSAALSDTYSAVNATNPTASNIAAKVWSDYESKIGTTISNAYSQAAVAGSVISDVQSYLVAMSGMLSDAHSAAILAASNASDAASYALVIQSRLSDYNSVYTSDMSDVRSMLAALSGAISDIDSATNSQYSDLASKIGNVSVAITASDISDIASATAAAIGFTPATIASKVWSDYESRMGTTVSNANSLALLAQSRISDIQSTLTLHGSTLSDTYSAAVVAQSINASDMSDLRSAINAATFTLGASDISDIASAVKLSLDSDLSDILSAARLAASHASDAHSAAIVAQSISASDMSDLRSAIAGVTATVSASDISDIASAVWATALATKTVTLNASDMSDIRSAIGAVSVTITASDISDIASATAAAVGFTPSAIAAKVWSDYESKIGTTASNAYSQAVGAGDLVSDVQSYLALISGAVSDVYSQLVALSGAVSDIDSATNSQYSDLASKVGAITVTVTASNISDIASATAAAMGLTTSGIAAKVWSDYESKIGTTASNAYSQAVGAGDLVSDVQSYLQQISGAVSDIYSLLSNTNSVVVGQGAGASASAIADKVWSDFGSKVGATPSQMYSAVLATQADVSDMHSDLLAMSGVLSDTYSAITSVRAEPGQGAPGASITALEKLDYLYKAWRNKKTQTATQFSLYADDATTVDQKATTSDDGATATIGEIATGP